MWVNHHTGKEFIIDHVSRKDYENFRNSLTNIVKEEKEIKKSELNIQLDYDPLKNQVTLYLVMKSAKIPVRGFSDEKYLDKKDFELVRRVKQRLNSKLDYLFQLDLD